VIEGPRAHVRLEALRRNLQAVRRAAPAAQVLAVVKANAYGHGLVPVARALEQCDGLGVARLGEALALREAGLSTPIVVLEGAFRVDELDAAAAHRLDIVVHAEWQIEMLEARHAGERIRVWVKVDTGMNRLGLRVEETAAALDRLSRCRIVAEAPRLMTHLATADELDDPMTRMQVECFLALGRDFGHLERSVANSAGVLAWPETHLEWVRPGIMLYGISPLPDRDAISLGLEPAMSLETSVIALRAVRAGEGVGYGATWRASADARIAIAAIGYGDGYPRHLPSGAPVLVRGIEAGIAGRVSMDMIAIDVSHIPAARVGDTVELWGRGLPVERVAAAAGTISYELVCGISQRVSVAWG